MATSVGKASANIAIGNFAAKSISYIVTIVLARNFLSKSDFGYLVTVDLIAMVFSQIVDVGFENYYLTKIQLAGKNPTPPEEIKKIEDITFSVRLFSNILLFLAQIAAGFFMEAPVRYLLWILSFNYISGIFGKINEVRLKKKLDFKVLAKAKIASELVAAFTKIGLAFLGWKILSIAVGIVVGNVVFVCIITSISRYKPAHIGIAKADRKQVLWFAKHSWYTGFVQYIHMQVDRFFLQFFFPVGMVGLYNFSASQTSGNYDAIMVPQGTLMVSHVSNNRDDKEKLNGLFSSMLQFVLILFAPIFIMAMIFAPFWVVLIFSSKWVEAVPLFQLFFGYCIIRLFGMPFVSNLLIMQKLKQNSIITTLWSCALLLGLFLAGWLKVPIEIYASIFILLSCGFLFHKSYAGTKAMGISIFSIFARYTKLYVILLAFAGLALSVFQLNPFGTVGNIVSMVLLPIIFFTMLLLFYRQGWYLFIGKLKSMLKRG